jgi:hypothetical protein
MAGTTPPSTTVASDRQALGQKYLDIYKARKDAFSAGLKADIAATKADKPLSGNKLVAKAAQLVVDLESIDKQAGPIYATASKINAIIQKYEDATEKFGKAGGSNAEIISALDELLGEITGKTTPAVDKEV